jgi:hypothetical protein
MRFEHQSLRQGLVFAACPSLGATGLSLIDRSVYGVSGSLVNMGGQDNWRASGSGVALNFDGSNDSVLVNFPTLTRYVSCGYWHKHTVAPTSNAFPNRQMGLNASGSATDALLNYTIVHSLSSISFIFTSATSTFSVLTGSRTPDTQWHHVMATCDWTTGAAAIYLDAVLIGSSTLSTTVATGTTSGNGRFGRHGNNVEFFNGQMDDLRVYNRVLTLAEIRLLASRRGIGLTPLPDRPAGLPKKLFVNDAGTWRDGDAYVNTGSGWRLGIPSVNDAGTWR